MALKTPRADCVYSKRSPDGAKRNPGFPHSAELGCSRVLPISIAQVGNIRLAPISGLPDIGTLTRASRKHPTCTDIGFTRYRHINARKSETSDLHRYRVYPISAH